MPRASTDPVETFRLFAAEGLDRRVLRRSLLSTPLVLVPAERPRSKRAHPLAGEGCHRLVIRSPQTFADGSPVLAVDVVLAWESGLRREASPLRWVLDPVVGVRELVLGLAEDVSGLTAEGRTLVVCVSRPVPDWADRMTHPALWLPEDDRGSGPYRRVAVDRYVASNDGDHRRIVLGSPGQDRRGIDEAADLAVVYGPTADAFAEAPKMTARRLDAWDRTYALWVHDRGRWVNDPRFRRWLARALDREAMAGVLFEGRGDAAYALTRRSASAPPGPARSARPFSRASSPRLALSFVENDRHAAALAFRIKAELEYAGLKIDLEPRSADDDLGVILRGGGQLVLLSHHPPVVDPVLGLRHTLAPLGGSARDARDRLDRASRVADVARRAARAGDVETALIEDGRLIPLVRLHAWLVSREGFAGIEAQASGVIRLDRARWRR